MNGNYTLEDLDRIENMRPSQRHVIGNKIQEIDAIVMSTGSISLTSDQKKKWSCLIHDFVSDYASGAVSYIDSGLNKMWKFVSQLSLSQCEKEYVGEILNSCSRELWYNTKKYSIPIDMTSL